ncbi:MAG: ABC transporter ATP-binding protein [Dehalococcoidales bacterium]|jgi:ABC-type polysaccharide/polyol phosphate transport system ATPase subunit
MSDAIVLEYVSKRFKRSAVSGRTTLKEAVLKGQIFRMGRSIGYLEALKDISFSIPPGTILGLIGSNGAGKSTLLRILADIYRPTSGKIKINGRVSLLSLGLGFHPEFSGRENITINGLALGLSHKQLAKVSADIIRFAELEDFIDAPMRTYSSGMYLRLAFSVAVNVNPDILLIDEVLAVGDARFTEKSRARIEEFKKSGTTIVLATHDLNTVENWCQQALFLNKGKICGLGEPKEIVAKYKQMTLTDTNQPPYN